MSVDKLDRKLIGQDPVYQILDSIIKDPPHIFLTGAFGYGKTSIANEFLVKYYKQFDIVLPNQEWCLHLSSDSDRGIHRIREGIAEFVRHTSFKAGIYRWILVDDSDTLPFVSQQALRRPMETHAHTTRFIFCSRHVSDLIAPLRSRCLHIEIETVSMNEILNSLTPSLPIQLNNKTKDFLLRMSLSPRHLIHYINCISAFGNDFNEEEFCNLFSGISDERVKNLIISFLRKNNEKIIELLFEIWNSGISYEDFLTDLSRCSKSMGFLPPLEDQRLHELMIQGWIYYTHGRTHILDIIALFRNIL